VRSAPPPPVIRSGRAEGPILGQRCVGMPTQPEKKLSDEELDQLAREPMTRAPTIEEPAGQFRKIP
jgi:hypothetical protein